MLAPDSFAPATAIRTVDADDYNRGGDGRRLCEGAAAMVGVSIDDSYVVAAHLSESAVWVDVLVPTADRSGPVLWVQGPGCRSDVSVLFRRFRG